MKWMSLLQGFSEPLIHRDTKRMHVTCNVFQTLLTFVGHLPFQEGLRATEVPLQAGKPGLRGEEEHSVVHANGQVAFLPLFFPCPWQAGRAPRGGITVKLLSAGVQPASEPGGDSLCLITL